MDSKIITIVLCSIMLMSTVSLADSKDKEAKDQFLIGLEFYEKGDYQQASIAFESAYKLKPSYKLLFNIGQVENQLAHYAAALEAYLKYMKEGGSLIESERYETVAGEIKRLKSLVGYVLLKGAPDGATVIVDKRRRGVTPLDGPLLLDLGDHELLVKSGNNELANELVRVLGGQQVEIDLSSETPTIETSPSETQPSIESMSEKPDKTSKSSKGKRVWTWVAFGIGGAGAVGAAVAGPIAINRTSQIKSDCGGTTCSPEESDKIDKAETAAKVATVMTAVAATGIVAGIILAIFEPKWTEKPVSVQPVASSENAGIMIMGRF